MTGQTGGMRVTFACWLGKRVHVQTKDAAVVNLQPVIIVQGIVFLSKRYECLFPGLPGKCNCNVYSQDEREYKDLSHFEYKLLAICITNTTCSTFRVEQTVLLGFQFVVQHSTSTL